MSLKLVPSLHELWHRIARRVLGLKDFDFKIACIKGSTTVVPDILSRNAIRKPQRQRCYDPFVGNLGKTDEMRRGCAGNYRGCHHWCRTEYRSNTEVTRTRVREFVRLCERK